MTLIEHNGEDFVFELQRRERQVFSAILQLYPVLNPDYHQISSAGAAEDRKLQESQALLREAMAEQQAQSKALVERFLAEENWEKHGTHYRVRMNGDQIEWLLQVLNDVRVGSWVILGKPDHEKGERPSSSVENMKYAGALELSGFFQMMLLQAREQ